MTALNAARLADKYGPAIALDLDGACFSFLELKNLTLAMVKTLQAHHVTQNRPLMGGVACPEPVALTARADLNTLLCTLALFEIGVPPVLAHPAWNDEERQRALSLVPVQYQWCSGCPMGIRDYNPTHETQRAPEKEDIAALMFTSGSSDVQKVVMLSHRALEASAEASLRAVPLGRGDRWLLNLPLAHVAGLMVWVRCLLAGATTVIRTHSQETIPQLVRSASITHLSVVPSQLSQWLTEERDPVPTLKRVLVGGAPCAPERLTDARQLGIPALATYGMTETCSQVATQMLADEADRPPRAIPGTELRIRDGVIEVCSDTLFSGYYTAGGNRPEAPDGNSASPAPDKPPITNEWFRTSDLGALSSDERLQVLGRSSDLIISGGENVHPLEVETILSEFPGIQEAVVFGVEDEKWGEVVAVALVAKDLDLKAFVEFCAQRLAKFRRPRRYALLDELPRTAIGKISRAQAHELSLSRLHPLG
ncbi:MAG: AMP-binding protein [Polyangiaceae bacterium]|nr:AMP-binding protein [Polyangiaceae bacterium]